MAYVHFSKTDFAAEELRRSSHGNMGRGIYFVELQLNEVVKESEDYMFMEHGDLDLQQDTGRVAGESDVAYFSRLYGENFYTVESREVDVVIDLAVKEGKPSYETVSADGFMEGKWVKWLNHPQWGTVVVYYGDSPVGTRKGYFNGQYMAVEK